MSCKVSTLYNGMFSFWKGNLLVAVVVLRGSRTMRRCVTNLFLVNLAFADLLVVLACLPFTLVAHLIYRK